VAELEAEYLSHILRDSLPRRQTCGPGCFQSLKNLSHPNTARLHADVTGEEETVRGIQRSRSEAETCDP
jgi:hypothetical protein